MKQSDFDNFSELLTTTAEMYNKTFKPTQTAIYFNVLSKFPIEAVRMAFNAHLQDSERGRFMPLPADLIGHLEKMRFDDRPSAEEAWSVAVQSIDDRLTVVWTEETSQAWFAAASELMAIGDKFNASRGFIAKYNDLVSLARLQGKQVVWVVSAGDDKDLRDRVIREAYQAKKITKAQAAVMLPYHQATDGVLDKIQNVALMIENKGATENHKALSRVNELNKAGKVHQERIAILRDAIGGKEFKRKNNPRECLTILKKLSHCVFLVIRATKSISLTLLETVAI